MVPHFEVIHVNDLAESTSEIVADWNDAVRIALEYYAEGHEAHIRYQKITVWVAGVTQPPADPSGAIAQTG